MLTQNEIIEMTGISRTTLTTYRLGCEQVKNKRRYFSKAILRYKKDWGYTKSQNIWYTEEALQTIINHYKGK